MEPMPVFDPFPTDYSEKLMLEHVDLIKRKVFWMQDVLGFHGPVKRKLSEQVGIRNLVIDCHYYDLAYHHYGKCPRIRLNGKWLERWGFKIGGRVNIITVPGLLILTPEEIVKTATLTNKRPPKSWRL